MSESKSFEMERAIAIRAVRAASKVCTKVFKNLANSQTIIKDDKSPVTVADFSSQAIINSILAKEFPSDSIVGEEDSEGLEQENGGKTLETIVQLTNSVLEKPLSPSEVLQSIDRGRYSGGPTGRHWTLDPIDGTKGFLRGGQFAVCLALIENGKVKVGVIGCPNLPYTSSSGLEKLGCLFVAVEGQGAYQQGLDLEERNEDRKEVKISVGNCKNSSDAMFCESVESGHSAHDVSEKIASLLNITKPPVRMDSQCKYGAIARGQADIYLRLPTSKSYVEKIWAGGIVTDAYGKKLDFSIGRTLSNNKGVIATNKFLYSEVLDSVLKSISK
ncbi:hypothetical protein BB559_005822 [Furculomyces boomerangus]|uniref:3'(2'),5'-bisphosphate nucleotidase n=1 Tax=Furculomyces boomerangus TaxID=61424 RepID=A0A2T9Y6F7_9FUNG|nr:hypothetical protein BB559_005822 [Furculomyces boomerangus]